MDEDDVHRKGLQRWPSSHVQIKQSETAGRPPRSPNGMLPCRVHVAQTPSLRWATASLYIPDLSASSPVCVTSRALQCSPRQRSHASLIWSGVESSSCGDGVGGKSVKHDACNTKHKGSIPVSWTVVPWDTKWIWIKASDECIT